MILNYSRFSTIWTKRFSRAFQEFELNRIFNPRYVSSVPGERPNLDGIDLKRGTQIALHVIPLSIDQTTPIFTIAQLLEEDTPVVYQLRGSVGTGRITADGRMLIVADIDFFHKDRAK